MEGVDRRNFLKLAGMLGGSVTVGALTPTIGLLKLSTPETLTFRAVAGLPAPPLPAYASYVLEGNVNLGAQSGVITRMVLAGAPEAMSDIALPGLSQTIRVKEVLPGSGILRIRGEVADRSQIGAGESPTVEIVVDRSRGIVRAPFLGSTLSLKLQG